MYVCIHVDAARQPNRILAHEPLQHRVVVPRPVVVEPRAIVLSRGVLDRVPLIGPERGRLPVGAVGVKDSPRRDAVVGMGTFLKRDRELRR